MSGGGRIIVAFGLALGLHGMVFIGWPDDVTPPPGSAVSPAAGISLAMDMAGAPPSGATEAVRRGNLAGDPGAGEVPGLDAQPVQPAPVRPADAELPARVEAAPAASTTPVPAVSAEPVPSIEPAIPASTTPAPAVSPQPVSNVEPATPASATSVPAVPVAVSTGQAADIQAPAAPTAVAAVDARSTAPLPPPRPRMAPPVAVAAAAPMAEAAVAPEPSIERSGDPGSRLATGEIQGRAGPPVTGETGPDPARAGEGAGQAATGSGAGTVNVSAGGAGGAPADYLGQLRAWLERNKDYPRMAQRRRIEGRVMLGFVIDRQGAVLSWRIERSSGHDILDAAVVDLIVRAAPLPAIPAGLALAQLDVVVPIDFGLR